jgi:hypothetical protein
MKKAGLREDYMAMLQPWYTMLNLGLSTFAEKPEPTRSDCHAWSSSPNYDFLATNLGIEPASPGFATVRIEPALGTLKWAEGRMPHPKGEIRARFKRQGSARWWAKSRYRRACRESWSGTGTRSACVPEPRRSGWRGNARGRSRALHDEAPGDSAAAREEGTAPSAW